MSFFGILAAARSVFQMFRGSKDEKEDDEEDVWTALEAEEEEDDVKTAIEPRIPRKKDIEWDGELTITKKEILDVFGIDEAARGEHVLIQKKEEIMDKNEEVPSMWDYDPRRLPKEFVGLEQDSFLMDPTKLNLCFLNKSILSKICSMLSVFEFLDLSLTCRFLHWRMFTSCTCYVPNTVQVKVADYRLKYQTYATMPKTVYYFDGQIVRPRWNVHYPWFAEEHGLRGLFIIQPTCLKGPFVFDIMQLELELPFFEKVDYERCLPWILPLRKYADRVKLIFHVMPEDDSLPFFDYLATNEFLKAVKVSSCFRGDFALSSQVTKEIYWKCPYARQMDEVWVNFTNADLYVQTLGNRIGCYENPDENTVKRTLQEFFYGSKNLEYHVYYFSRTNTDQLLEYIFNQYDDFEEYYSEEDGHVWDTTIMTEKTGRKLKMKICKASNDTAIAVGKEKIFDQKEEEDTLFNNEWRDPPEVWKMETAVEGDSDEDERDDEDDRDDRDDEEPAEEQ